MCTIFQEIRVFGSLQNREDWSKRRNFFSKIVFLVSLARNALILVIGTVISYCLYEEAPFKITGNVTGGFPAFQVPPFSTTFNGTNYDFEDLAKGYGISFVFIPLLSILEAVTIAKAFCINTLAKKSRT